MLPAARDRDFSPRAKRSNTCGSSAAGMPGPVSVTVRTTSPVRLSGASPTVTSVPGGVWVRALASRFVSTWVSRDASPTVDTGSSGSAIRHR